MAWCLTAQESLQVMFYNLLEFPEANPPNREFILRDILNTYEPDIFMVCELQNEIAGNLILDESLNDTEDLYESAVYVTNQSSASNLQQLLYFRKDKFILESQENIVNGTRDINHYTLKVRTANINTDPVFLEVYVAHLKSSQGGANQAERLAMVQEFVTNTEALSPDSFVIFAGDFNLYTSTEPAYIELLDPTNAIPMVDPIDTPGSWNNNLNFQDIHTQSTRESSGPFGAGAGGGLDDRFDFIMLSENMLTNPKMRYIPYTYAAYVNNGNCFNLSINDESCTGTFPQETRELLYQMSDHLPVVLQLETEEEIVLSAEEMTTVNPLVEIQQNPVSEILTLQIPTEGTFDFEIFDILGQEIMAFSSEGRENLLVDVSKLPSGVYFLKVQSQIIHTLKFLKQ